MATILVVDDKRVNREFLTTLLGYSGHRLLEAGDGAEALAQVRAEHPALVIADVVMPTMDGYELVRQLRSDPTIAQTPVIFYTATYHEREAQALAEACGVSHILTKPAEPETVLRIVNAALSLSPPPPAAPTREFDREHLRLVTDKLSEKVNDLEAATLRLTALLEVGQKLASQLDPLGILNELCPPARELIGARYAAVGLLAEDGRTLRHFFTRGTDVGTARGIGFQRVDQGVLAQLLTEGHPLRLRDIGTDPVAQGMPPAYLPTRSFLGVRLSSPSQLYGILYLIEKLGAEEFSEEDERLIATLGAQAGVAYENARQHNEIQKHAAALKREVMERKRAEEEIQLLNAELEKRVADRTAELTDAIKELEAFTYSVSHDLRAPLRHIDGFSKILLEDFGPQLDAPAQQYLQRIHQATQHMGGMVDDLLSLARFSRQELNLQITGLNALVEEIVAGLKADTSDRQIDWQLQSLPFVECDPGLVKQVFANLLSNAVKYTRPRECAIIEVGRTTRDSQPVIFVRDNGVGFNLKYADKLFGVFQRLHRPQDFEGTGVGLAIVQRIIHKHGGRIWAEAELNKGATFFFTLGAPKDSRTDPQFTEGSAVCRGTDITDMS